MLMFTLEHLLGNFRMKLFFSLTLTTSLLIIKGCGEDAPKEHPYRSPNVVWKARLADTGLLRDVIEADIQYYGGVLFSGISANTRSLYLLNNEDGSVRWKWSDYFTEDYFWIARYPYHYQSTLLIPEGRNLYVINLQDGSTKFKKRLQNYASEPVSCGINDEYYMLIDFFNSNATVENRIVIGNLNDNAESTQYITPEYSRNVVQPQNGLIGTLDGFAPTKIDGKDYLVIFFGDPNEILYDIDMYLGLYDLKNQKWVYAKKPSVSRAKSRCGESPAA